MRNEIHGVKGFFPVFTPKFCCTSVQYKYENSLASTKTTCYDTLNDEWTNFGKFCLWFWWKNTNGICTIYHLRWIWTNLGNAYERIIIKACVRKFQHITVHIESHKKTAYPRNWRIREHTKATSSTNPNTHKANNSNKKVTHFFVLLCCWFYIQKPIKHSCTPNAAVWTEHTENRKTKYEWKSPYKPLPNAIHFTSIYLLWIDDLNSCRLQT